MNINRYTKQGKNQGSRVQITEEAPIFEPKVFKAQADFCDEFGWNRNGDFLAFSTVSSFVEFSVIS